MIFHYIHYLISLNYRSAQYNINAPWVSTLKDNLESIRSSTLTARLFAQSSAFNIVLRHSSAMGAFEDESGEWVFTMSHIWDTHLRPQPRIRLKCGTKSTGLEAVRISV